MSLHLISLIYSSEYHIKHQWNTLYDSQYNIYQFFKYGKTYDPFSTTTPLPQCCDPTSKLAQIPFSPSCISHPTISSSWNFSLIDSLYGNYHPSTLECSQYTTLILNPQPIQPILNQHLFFSSTHPPTLMKISSIILHILILLVLLVATTMIVTSSLLYYSLHNPLII
jgi:hypothetical protein